MKGKGDRRERGEGMEGEWGGAKAEREGVKGTGLGRVTHIISN